jgi:2-polyprenyl-3-methyl-5-hydroxy-6-metoxy-1,4-benzoquinol methylase
MNTNCPICQSKSLLKEKIGVDKIKSSLETYFQSKISDDLELLDYSIFECSLCSYSFSFPLIEGSNKFYTWITNQNTYYPLSRWEYGQVLNIINERNLNSLLDVGCGDGVFLDYIKSNSKIENLFGIDTTQSSINDCQIKGLKNTFCCTTDEFINHQHVKFDLVTTFHVLEHISDPINFIGGLKKLIKQDGMIVISTPYSPMDFEYYWFDILNKPPHHMGFWNERSYRKLAEQLNMNITVAMPPNNKILPTLINSLKLLIYGPSNDNKINPFYLILSNPLLCSKMLFKLFFRKKVNDKRASNVIMVMLKNK